MGMTKEEQRISAALDSLYYAGFPADELEQRAAKYGLKGWKAPKPA